MFASLAGPTPEDALPAQRPANSADVEKLVEQRLAAQREQGGLTETITIDWRGAKHTVPVVTMPVDVLHYNPDTHRVRAQRTMDPVRDEALRDNPYGTEAQNYLHYLLSADPAEPTKRDPAFEALKEDLQAHGQNDPGIITRSGVLVNGNTRCAALKELAYEYIKVGVLPPDAGLSDIQAIELSLQLVRDLKREYSFMNSLLALDERVQAGRPEAEIIRDFRITSRTFAARKWILEFVRDAITRSASAVQGADGVGLRLIDFEQHQGKLEELYTAYQTTKKKSREDAELLREQRLLAMVLNKSKTDLRLIEPDFVERYMNQTLPASETTTRTLPGTSVPVAGPSKKVEELRKLTDSVLQAQAVAQSPEAPPDAVAKASQSIADIRVVVDKALDQAGRTARVTKKRFLPAERISDAADSVRLAVAAVAEARATGAFTADDIEDALLQLKDSVTKLAALAARATSTEDDSEVRDGLAWLLNTTRSR